MRKALLVSFISTIAVVSFLLQGQVGAAPVAGFKAGEIMDDAVMTNSGSMSVSQIQSFLNSKVPNCDTNGTAQSEFGGGTRAQWAAVRGHKPPFTCLRDYKEGGKTSAQIILEKAQKYSINPQSLIVLLQKEQALVTDTWPLSTQFKTATGYGCPDTAPCDTQYFGLSNQLDWAAKMFRSIINQSPGWYSPYFKGNNPRVYWNPATSCGAQSLDIKNWSTASLYSYTPYRPNQAALDAGYGTGNSCSSYGNRNFYQYFKDWFGSTQFPQPTGASLYRQASTGRIFLVITNGDNTQTRFYVDSPAALDNYKLSSYATVSASDEAIVSLRDGGTLSNIIRTNSGDIYMVNDGTKHKFSGPSICTRWGADCFNSNIVKNLGEPFAHEFLSTGTNLSEVAMIDSAYYKIEGGSKLPFGNKDSLIQSGYSTSQAVNLNNTNSSSLRIGKLILTTPGVVRFSPKTEIYVYTGTEYVRVPDMDIYSAWNVGNLTNLSVPKSTYNTSEQIPSAISLDYWTEDNNGNKYVIYDGTKLKLSNEQVNLWPNAIYSKGLDTVVNNLKSENLTEFIKSGIHFMQLTPSGEKRYIANLDDYYALGGTNSNTRRLSGALVSTIPTGPYAFPNGKLIKVEGDTTIYVMNKGSLMHVSSMTTLNAYRFDTSTMRTYPRAAVLEYDMNGQLSHSLLDNGSATIVNNDSRLVLFTPSQISSYGLEGENLISVSDALASRAVPIHATNVLRNSDSGSIYYATHGSIHYVSSMSTLKLLAGDTNVTSVPSSAIDLFKLGEPY